MKLQLFLFLSILVLAASYPAQAHHAANANFIVTESTEIEGYVKEFSFKNPHVTIIVTATDEDGNEKEWIATGPAVSPFRSIWGWTEDMLEEGQYVRLIGRKARFGGPMILMEREDIEAGSLHEIDPVDGSIVRVLYGEAAARPAPVAAIPATLPNGLPNLSGSWRGGGGGGPGSNPWAGMKLNAAGQTYQNNYDPGTMDLAYTECAPQGLIRMVTNGQRLGITQHDDYLLIDQELDGSQRIVYLDGREPATNELTPLGHSVGRYEGDTLIIETNQLLGGPTGPRGNVLTDQVTVVERYTRADSGEESALQLEVSISDPGHLAEPWVSSLRKTLTADTEFVVADCRVPVLTSSD
jgi:hypothetical protein